MDVYVICNAAKKPKNRLQMPISTITSSDRLRFIRDFV